MPEEARRGDAELVRDFLASRDSPCPGCTYNLRGVAGDRCPGCNHLIQLGITPSEPGAAAHLRAVIGLSWMGSAAATVLLAVVVMTATSNMRDGIGSREFRTFVTAPAIVLALDAALIYAVASPAVRRWFARSSILRRTAAVVGCFALSLVVILGWCVRAFVSP